MPASIDIATERVDSAVVYAVSGEMDLATASQLGNHLDLDGQESVVVLDLTDVTFIDSTGLRAIVSAHEEAADAAKELRVVPGERVMRLLEITGVHERLTVCVDRAAALADG